MKKLNFLFLGLLSFMPIWGCNDDDSLPEAVVEVQALIMILRMMEH